MSRETHDNLDLLQVFFITHSHTDILYGHTFFNMQTTSPMPMILRDTLLSHRNMSGVCPCSAPSRQLLRAAHAFYTVCGTAGALGLHVSPEGSSDDVFRQVGPNQTASYTYQIPSDHPVGSFWYHPHAHGSSSLQQGGGMAGALIVEAADPGYLPPALAAMAEAVLVLQHLCFYTEGKYRNPNPYINHMNVSVGFPALCRPSTALALP